MADDVISEFGTGGKSTKIMYSFAVVSKTHATTSNGCPKSLITMLHSSNHSQTNGLKRTRNNTQRINE